MNMCVKYLPDECVDDVLDGALRALFVACFTKPEDAAIFRERRYWIEPYRHRWVIRDPDGQVVAHVGVHDRYVETDEQRYDVGGIAEVCVHPTYRGRGCVKAMLVEVHAALAARGIPFALLFGNPKMYGSSGYVSVSNL